MGSRLGRSLIILARRRHAEPLIFKLLHQPSIDRAVFFRLAPL